MTAEQFDNHAWRSTDRIKYQDKEYPVVGVDFDVRSIITIIGSSYEVLNHSEIELVNKLEK